MFYKILMAMGKAKVPYEIKNITFKESGILCESYRVDCSGCWWQYQIGFFPKENILKLERIDELNPPIGW